MATMNAGGMQTPSLGPASARLRHLIVVLAVAIVGAFVLGDHWPSLVDVDSSRGLLTLVAAAAVYAGLLALPFVPSVEIGVFLMVVFGPSGALAAYLATQLGLNLAYLVGVVAGRRSDCADCAVCTPHLVQRWLQRISTERPTWLSGRGVPAVVLAVMLNLPGNTVAGGGGGIGLGFGATRLLTWPAYALVVAVATSIVPALFVIGFVGVEQLGSLFAAEVPVQY